MNSSVILDSYSNQKPAPVTRAITEDTGATSLLGSKVVVQPQDPVSSSAGAASYVMAAIVFLAIAAAATMVLLSSGKDLVPKQTQK